MKRMLINATQPEVRVAIIDNGALVDLDVEPPEQQQNQSNIYKGVITSLERSLDAAFVDYGRERHGFLPLKEISKEYFISQPEELSNIDIKQVLKVGQEVVVQVQKEERDNKGAALTTFISLAGSYLVLMPNNPKAGGISRRIEGDEREQMKEALNKLDLAKDMGVILRTAGVSKTANELTWDLHILLRYWEAIKQAAIAKPGPYLIHKESDVIIRAIRDYCRQDINEIIIDDENAFNRALEYFKQVRPDFTERLRLYSDHLPLFSRFQIDQQIENAYQREVRLPSGGSLSIDPTEALVAIDINSARATKGSSIEETAFQTNKEAAEEIARQLKIRDLGGLIVIDFIDMTSNQNQRNIENHLREATQNDRARIQIGKISRFGLLEMSRQRIRSSLNTATQVTCPHCSGLGTIRSVESLGRSVVHLIQEHAAKLSEGQLQIQLPVDVATFIINEKREILENIKQHSSLSILIIPNPHFKSPHYEIKVVRENNSRQIPSYKLMTPPKTGNTAHKKQPRQDKHVEPAINEFLLKTPHKSNSHYKKHNDEGLIKRFMNAIFGTEPPKLADNKAQRKASSNNNNKPTHKPAAKKKTTKNQPNKAQDNRSRRGSRGGQKKKTQTGDQQNKDTAKQQTAKRKNHPQKNQSPAPKKTAQKKQAAPEKKANANKNNQPAEENKTNTSPSQASLPVTNAATKHSETQSKVNQKKEATETQTTESNTQSTTPSVATKSDRSHHHPSSSQEKTDNNQATQPSSPSTPIQQVKTKKQQTPNDSTAPSAKKDNAAVTENKEKKAEKKQTPPNDVATASVPKTPPPHLQQVKTKKDNTES